MKKESVIDCIDKHVKGKETNDYVVMEYKDDTKEKDGGVLLRVRATRQTLASMFAHSIHGNRAMQIAIRDAIDVMMSHIDKNPKTKNDDKD